jgi:hypothetical protein
MFNDNKFDCIILAFKYEFNGYALDMTSMDMHGRCKLVLLMKNARYRDNDFTKISRSNYCLRISLIL